MKFSFPWLNKAKASPGRVGIAIENRGLTLAALDSAGDVMACDYMPMDSWDEIAPLLTSMVDQRDWHGMFASLVLPVGHYHLALSEAPAVQGDEMAQAVRWKIKDLLNYPVEEAVIDHFMLPDDAYRGRQKMLYAASISQQSLSQLVAMIEQSGLALGCVEITELALHNLQSRLPPERGGQALMYLADGLGLVNLVEEGAVYFTRGLEGAAGSGGDPLVLEIQRSLDYYESQMGKGIITQLHYLLGESEAPLGEFLSQNLGLNVGPLPVADLLSIAESAQGQVTPEQLVRFAVALGAAMGAAS